LGAVEDRGGGGSGVLKTGVPRRRLEGRSSEERGGTAGYAWADRGDVHGALLVRWKRSAGCRAGERADLRPRRTTVVRSALPRGHGPGAPGGAPIGGRSSDSWALTGEPAVLLAVASRAATRPSAHDGVRSHSPLRGSPGVAPGSLLPRRPLWGREPSTRGILHLVVPAATHPQIPRVVGHMPLRMALVPKNRPTAAKPNAVSAPYSTAGSAKLPANNARSASTR
jgi:hypothetical protein